MRYYGSKEINILSEKGMYDSSKSITELLTEKRNDGKVNVVTATDKINEP